MQALVNVGEVVDGKYRIDQILGLGGMSVVARAYHLELGKPVALKILRCPDENFEDAVRRFRREAQVLAHIKSEHVVRILDLGTMSDGSPYIVMEFLEGNDLRDELDRRGPLEVVEAAGYVLQALEALAETHAQDVVHRDLKPQNLILARGPDGTRSIKVIDFGVSKFVTPSSPTELSMTKTSWFIGSPWYMSPEQMRSARSVDHRTDIWSFGAILYEMVSGRVPYVAETIPELCAMLIEATPPPLQELCRSLPPGFAAVVERCLEKDRNLRYSNVGELANALAPFAEASQLNADRIRRVVQRCALSMIPPAFSAESPSQHKLERTFQSHPATGSLAPSVLGTESPRATVSTWRHLTRGVTEHPAGTLVSVALVAIIAVFGFALAPQGETGGAGSSSPPAGPTRTPAVFQNDANSAFAAFPDAALPSLVDPGAAASASSKPTLGMHSNVPVPSAPMRRVPTARLARRAVLVAPARPAPPPANAAEAAVPEAPILAPARKVDAWDPASFGGRH